MSMVYLIAVFCFEPHRQPPWLRTTAVEAPACMEHREEYAGSVRDCNQYAVTQDVRLAALHEKPFVYRGSFCRDVKR